MTLIYCNSNPGQRFYHVQSKIQVPCTAAWFKVRTILFVSVLLYSVRIYLTVFFLLGASLFNGTLGWYQIWLSSLFLLLVVELLLPVLANRWAHASFAELVTFWFILLVFEYLLPLEWSNHYLSSTLLVSLQVITGYLLAGSVIGPGGLSFVSEMVQVTYISFSSSKFLFLYLHITYLWQLADCVVM